MDVLSKLRLECAKRAVEFWRGVEKTRRGSPRIGDVTLDAAAHHRFIADAKRRRKKAEADVAYYESIGKEEA